MLFTQKVQFAAENEPRRALRVRYLLLTARRSSRVCGSGPACRLDDTRPTNGERQTTKPRALRKWRGGTPREELDDLIKAGFEISLQSCAQGAALQNRVATGPSASSIPSRRRWLRVSLSPFFAPASSGDASLSPRLMAFRWCRSRGQVSIPPGIYSTTICPIFCASAETGLRSLYKGAALVSLGM